MSGTNKRWPKWLGGCMAAAAVAAVIVACGGGESGTPASTGSTSTNTDPPVIAAVPPADTGAQRVKHVFVITLENKNYADTFGAGSTQDPYLKTTLPAMGALFTQYYGTGHASLTNYIAMISGQPVTPETTGDCTTYKDFVQTGTTADGIPVGTGCVYPASVKTLPDQLKAKGLTWRGYMEDMGNDPTRESATCGHPVINTTDQTNKQLAPSAAVPKGDQYASRHNPFMYFHSIIDSPDCNTNVVALDKFEADLARIETTPNFSFITPNVCNDGHDGDGTGVGATDGTHRCADGNPGGLTQIDAFLKIWVPKIMASEAFKKDGLLIINFDENAASGVVVSTDGDGKTHYTVNFGDESCCKQPAGPNVSYPFTQVFPISATAQYDLTFPAQGGGRTGAVMISPFIKAGTVIDTPHNHYSLLRSIEQIFSLPEYLGYANQADLASFATPAVFAN